MSKVKLKIDKGTTFRFPFRWHDGAGNSYIPDATFRCHFRETIDSPEILLNLTTENGGFVKGTLDGSPVAYLCLNPDQTSPLLATRAVFDVEGILSNGEVSRLFEGTASFTPEVTR